MILAYLFDLDGTLVDTEVIWVEALETFLNDRGHAFSHEQAQELVYGRSWQDIYKDLIREYADLRMNITRMEAEIEPYYRRLTAQRDVRIPSSIELLKTLAQEAHTCIVSGSSRQTIARAIDEMGVGDCVEFFLGAEDYSPGKPDPACYRLAAERLALEPEQCLVFEDSSAGVLSAKAAGMFCVALRRTGAPGQDVSMADQVVSDLHDFDPRTFASA